jgi:hypothetical protein
MIGTGVKGDAFRPLGATYASDWAFFTGAGRNRVLFLGRAADWTAADIDAGMDRFNPGGLLDAFNGVDALVNFLRAHVIGELTPAQRTAALTKLQTLGVDTSGLILSSTLLDAILAVRTWFGGSGSEVGSWIA